MSMYVQRSYKMYGINHTRCVLASSTYCSIHLLYINTRNILCMSLALCKAVIIHSQSLGKLSFESTQETKKKFNWCRYSIDRISKWGERISKPRVKSYLKVSKAFPLFFLDRFCKQNN